MGSKMIERHWTRRCCVAVGFVLSCFVARPAVAQDNMEIIRAARAQWDQVWSVKGRWVYTSSTPGREQKIKDIGKDYDPATSDYYPDSGPDTLFFAQDMRTGRIRFDDNNTMVLYGGMAAGRVYRESTRYFWDGQELRVRKRTQMGNEPASETGEIRPFVSMPWGRRPIYALTCNLTCNDSYRLLVEIMSEEPSRVLDVAVLGSDSQLGIRRVSLQTMSKVVIDLDPSLGYSIIRTEAILERPPWRRVTELEVTEFQPGIWYPASWRMVDYHVPSGKLLSEFVMKALDVSINEELPDSLFVHSFPAGLKMKDYTGQAVGYVQPPGAVDSRYVNAIADRLQRLGRTETGILRTETAALLAVAIVVIASALLGMIFHKQRVNRHVQ